MLKVLNIRFTRSPQTGTAPIIVVCELLRKQNNPRA
jgi:hypothetical protein